MDNPCVRDCPDRNATCHCTCEKYIAYAKWREEKRKEAREKAAVDAAANHGRNRRFAMKMYTERHKNE